MGVRRTALADDGYHSGIFAEGLVRRLRGPRTRSSTGAASGMFGISRTGLRPKRAKRLAKPMARTLQKNIRVTPEQWKRVENAAEERDVSANRLVVELAMEALDRREWPCTELEIQLLRFSMFAARAMARDLISSGREQEIGEIRDFISTILPDGHTGEPIHGRSDDHPDDAELIRGRRERIRWRSLRDTRRPRPADRADLSLCVRSRDAEARRKGRRRTRRGGGGAGQGRPRIAGFGSRPRVGMNIASDNGQKDSARHRDTGVGRGTPATNGLMFVMVASYANR